jgi:hypothetical protein
VRRARLDLHQKFGRQLLLDSLVGRFNVLLRVELVSDSGFRYFPFALGLGTLKFEEFGKLAKHFIVYALRILFQHMQSTIRYLDHAAFRR